MHIAFLNPQGNFDPQDRYWTAHPDFGGQLVYVKEVALALGRMGHQVDILTRRIVDPEWAGFEATRDAYPGEPNVRIVRLPCGGDRFLRKEDLWPHLGTEWLPNVMAFYAGEDRRPDVVTSHYGDGGLVAALWHAQGGPPFTFTAHSLGAQKLDRLLLDKTQTLAGLDAHYHFAHRLAAERVAMNHAARVITSTYQERMEQYGHPAYHGAVDPNDDAKFAVVPPGVNLRIFDAGARGPGDEQIAEHIERVLTRDVAPERRKLPAVLCSSRLDPKKNHVGLVRAFAQSGELQEAANLLIVVRGAEDIHSRQGFTPAESAVLDEIVALCETHGLWGKVSAFSLESQSELAAAYRYLVVRRSAFALTTHYEPFGLAPLEAMAAGLPAVVTRNGGPSESLFDADTGTEYGVLVDPTDPADVAAGLLRLLGPDSEWDRFHRAGRQRVLDRYTWERTATGYLAVLDGLQAIQAAHRFQAKLPIPAYFNHPTPENDGSLSRPRIAPRELPNPRFWPGWFGCAHHRSGDPGRAETRAQPPEPDLDLVAIGETLVDFISLEQAEEGLRDATAFGRHMGGSPANIAVYVAKLGGRAAVVSKTGADAFGQFLRDELRFHGVNADYLVCDPGVHTTVIFVSRTSGRPDFAAFRDGDYRLTPDEVPEEVIARAKVVHASTFALSRQPCRSAIGKALRLAHQQGKIVSLDPNYRPRIWPDYEEAQQVVRAMYRYATITKPSLDDAQCFFGSGHSPEQYIQMFHELGPRTVILTMGKEGTLLSHDGRLLGHVPARPGKVVDATAAGDAFWAGFLVALLDGHPLARCVLFAREIAELKLTTVGPLPSTIDRDQIYARLPRTATDVRLAWS